jgi:hypothetical protein
MVNGSQWNGEEYHMCNECMRNYITQVQILDGPSDDDDADDNEEDPQAPVDEDPQ